MTFKEAQVALCRKLETSYDEIVAGNNDLFSIDDVKEYLRSGIRMAWDLHRWPFTEGSKTVTPDVKLDYYEFPNDFLADSIYLLMVGGKEYDKRSWQSYLKYKQDCPTGKDKVYAFYKNFIFINILSYGNGDAIDIYGKSVARRLADDIDLMPFSPTDNDDEYSGNDAIVRLAYAEALSSEKMKNPAQGNAERTVGLQTLEILWKPFAEFLATEKQHGRPFFEPPDFFSQNRSRF